MFIKRTILIRLKTCLIAQPKIWNIYVKLMNELLKYLMESLICFTISPILDLNFQSNKFNSTMYGLKRVVTIGLLLFCNSLALKEILSRKWRDEHYFNLSILIGSVLLVRLNKYYALKL